MSVRKNGDNLGEIVKLGIENLKEIEKKLLDFGYDAWGRAAAEMVRQGRENNFIESFTKCVESGKSLTDAQRKVAEEIDEKRVE